MDGTLTPLQRLFLAFVAFFYVLANRRFAEEVSLARARQRGELPPSPAAPEPPPPVTPPRPTPPPPPEVGPPKAEPPPPVTARPRPPESPPQGGPIAAPAPLAPVPDHAEALRVLALLQRDGRLLDFVSESLEGFGDADIGAAARTVHAGCKKVITTYLTLEPIYAGPEDARVTVAPGFDPAAVRLSGAVVGSPPFQGSLKHHGWRVVSARFPPAVQGQDPRILAPAEVEL